MSKTYYAVPLPKDWEKDMEWTGLGGLIASRPPAAVRVWELIAEWHKLHDGYHVGQAEVLGEIWLQLRFLRKYASKAQDKARDREKGLSKAKSGAEFSSSSAEAIEGLYQYCSTRLMTLLPEPQPNVESKFKVHFGRGVSDEEALQDQTRLANGTIHWMDAAERRKHKLSFRAGIAHVKRQGDAGQEILVPYDTAEEGDALEKGGANLFVMDGNGRIYAGARMRTAEN